MINDESIAFLRSIDPLTVLGKINRFRALNIRG